ncbi:hypothetical protein RD110_14735 [Rhodoferax koreense]|uniref:PAAR domain-containing protein n=1 Tax=Rhodoferax koreensis TaxID=1842727 RepID=A0A1P8JX05_9BURK|nr:PAAR domain-containing protein [Rhodoferax koreense]APW38290.1 hypothetical protein RD110_14735 [Rhodoferax koreense]
MARRIILVGDPTSHDGVVLSGSPAATIGGKAIARLGDEVSCPRHGNNKIVEGETGYTIGGVPVALEGHHGECGCSLIGTTTASVG